MVYAKFGGQTECIMGNSKIENGKFKINLVLVKMNDRLALLTEMQVVLYLKGYAGVIYGNPEKYLEHLLLLVIYAEICLCVVLKMDLHENRKL